MGNWHTIIIGSIVYRSGECQASRGYLQSNARGVRDRQSRGGLRQRDERKRGEYKSQGTHGVVYEEAGLRVGQESECEFAVLCFFPSCKGEVTMGGVALSEEVKHAIIDKGCRSVMRRNFFRESKSKRRRVEEGMHSKKVVILIIRQF